MVVIMGWGDARARDRGEVAPATCPKCHNYVFMHEVHSEKQFSLYFVPLSSYFTGFWTGLATAVIASRPTSTLRIRIASCSFGGMSLNDCSVHARRSSTKRAPDRSVQRRATARPRARIFPSIRPRRWLAFRP